MIPGDRYKKTVFTYSMPSTTFTTFKYVISSHPHRLREVVTRVSIYTIEKWKSREGVVSFSYTQQEIREQGAYPGQTRESTFSFQHTALSAELQRAR